MNQREIALNILNKTIKDESYSNLLMRKELEKLPSMQRSFVTNLVNGVLRKYEFLSYQFEDEINNKTSLKVRLILCMALFERFVLKEKDYVVNNEYVELCADRYEKSFVNALLHRLKELKVPQDEAVKANLPGWIYRLLKSQYSQDDLDRIIDTYQRIPVVYYRINHHKTSFDELKKLDIDIINDDIFTSKHNLFSTEEYHQGYFYIQDINSASLYKHLDLNEDCTLLDICSAPGSKLFNCLDIIREENAYGNDVHENRVELIRKMTKRLGFEKINLTNCDGRKLKDELNMQFDRIMLDAPCSGLGVISRKPDLKFHIRPENLDELQVLQQELLESSLPLLKENGILLYSTCTLNRKENDKQIKAFLDKHKEIKLLEEETIINEEGDCFYYAKLRKVEP